jgi:propanediol dehydratase small subunit
MNIDNTFEKHVVGMMADYDITMFDALLWDFESYLTQDADIIYEKAGAAVLENKFRKYLELNEVPSDRREFYADIFMGRASNMELKKDAEAKNQ